MTAKWKLVRQQDPYGIARLLRIYVQSTLTSIARGETHTGRTNQFVGMTAAAVASENILEHFSVLVLVRPILFGLLLM